MNQSLFPKIAWNNIKKNKNVFFPFFLVSTTMIAMFYMMYAIYENTSEGRSFYGAENILLILDMGVKVSAIVSAAVIFYTNRFLMRQRAKEMGLYSILGMEKRHVARIVFFENGMISLGSLATGCVSGILLSKLMYMVMLKMIGQKVAVSFFVSKKGLLLALILFGGIFIINMVFSAIQLGRMKPIELLRQRQKGEGEPKAHWLQAILGVILLGIGYYISITSEDPMKVIGMFLAAVLCVIAGTYLLFQSGLVAWLKLLKKNEKYYYNKKHFITVSSLMYRMKQNANGLATICILSTAVLVTISTTVSLYVGIDDSVAMQHPREVSEEFDYDTDVALEDASQPKEQKIKEITDSYVKKQGLELRNAYGIHTIYTNIKKQEDGSYQLQDKSEGHVFSDTNSIIGLSYGLDEYNVPLSKEEKLAGLKEGEVWAWAGKGKLQDGMTIKYAQKEYKIHVIPDNIAGEEMSGMPTMVVVFPSYEGLKKEMTVWVDSQKRCQYDLDWVYHFDLSGTTEQKRNCARTLWGTLEKEGIQGLSSVENIFDARKDCLGLYASLLFIGMFVGIMFLIITAMILYYKQISEGQEDRERFIILQKVGMSRQEVRRVITSQILQVFFLPLLVAGIHIVFAFPVLKRIMLMMLANIKVVVICTIVTFFAFAIVYAIMYCLTAKVYEGIVNAER